MSIGPLEIVIVLVLALLVFGPKQLPQAGRSLGRAVREFRKATETARAELGLDEVVDGINEVKSSVSLGLKDSGVTDVMKDLKSSTTIDLNATGKAAAAPAVDKPVQVSAPADPSAPGPGPEAATIPAAVSEAEAAGADTTATGAPAERDDA